MKVFYLIVFASFLLACETGGVKRAPVKDIKKEKVKANVLDKDHKVLKNKRLSSGISIDWYEFGKGENLQVGDLVLIDYKVKLKDGSVVDGNHLLKRESLPFLLGFNMQTPGWDIALKELKVGDFAKIFIPSSLARGEVGIEGLIPPNADNLLYIRILKNQKPDREINGTKVWILEENKTNQLKFNEKTKIEFHAMASSPSSPVYVNTFRSNQPFSYTLKDHGLVPGLRNALINAKKSDRIYILIPASEAYGKNGYLDFVKPNEPLFYNVLVMDVKKL